MSRLDEFKLHLKQGQVYRREELSEWSNAIDRHLDKLVEERVLEKLSQGLYYVPKMSAFGKVPPDEDVLVRGFLKDNRFLLVSPNSYNSLGVGTTQLYNKKVVYNHKRHGRFRLGNREFDFQRKYDFPSKMTLEFLLVDLANNLDELAEDREEVLNKLLVKASQMPSQKLKHAISRYGSMKTKKLLKSALKRKKYMPDYLHDHKDFADLIKILAEEKGIEPGLVEKDYWIMHVLYGLKKQGFDFELKGGTSLSKGYKIIHRFSEDIDIHIKPPEKFKINENPKNTNDNNAAKRKDFYDWLATEIIIQGIVKVARDHEFDTDYYRSGGIRLFYNNLFDKVEGSKEGILLEAGFDDITPNDTLTITSWAYDRAVEKGVKIEDNKAKDIKCYHPGYTFVEKLQTISTKFRTEQEDPAKKSKNLMRQYYDVYCLLAYMPVLDFIGTEAYTAHKEKRFRAGDKAVPVYKNQGFLLTDKAIREDFKKRYLSTAKLYYQGQPSFEDLMARIAVHIKNL